MLFARAIQINPPLAQPTPPAWTRLETTQSDCSGSRTRVLTPKTRRWRVKWRFSSPKPEPLDLTDVIYKSGQLQQDQA